MEKDKKSYGIENGVVDTEPNEDGVPKWMTSIGDTIDIFEMEKTRVFSISPGMKGNTQGIVLLSHPYVITKSDGEKMCLLIMDTQGLSANGDNKFNSSVFGLSCLLSSYVIYSQKGNINTDQLKQLLSLCAFAKGDGQPFQHMDLLMRDYENYAKRDDVAKGIEMSEERLKSMLEGGIEGPIAKGITECFSEFDVFCFPTPGEEVMDSEYDGAIGDIKPRFMRFLSYYIDRIIQSIQPRRLGDEVMTGKRFVEWEIVYDSMLDLLLSKRVCSGRGNSSRTWRMRWIVSI